VSTLGSARPELLVATLAFSRQRDRPHLDAYDRERLAGRRPVDRTTRGRDRVRLNVDDRRRRGEPAILPLFG